MEKWKIEWYLDLPGEWERMFRPEVEIAGV